jgi:trk system potassium uptake protein TrkH
MHPTRVIVIGYLIMISIGTFALMLPIASANGAGETFLVALFTTVSAVCVTGLTLVDTGTHWTTFGQWTILTLIQIGGFGIMTASTLLGLMINRSIRLKSRMVAQTETHTIGAGDLKSVVKLVLFVTIVIELIMTVALFLSFWLRWEQTPGEALWNGFFHAISAFNNAGFSLYENSLMMFSSDLGILLPIMMGVVIGGIGFPVLFDLKRSHWQRPNLSLHSKLTLWGTAILLVFGTLLFLLFEWSNPATFGAMSIPDKILSAVFASVSSRTAGFNTVDVGAFTHETWSIHFLLMFVGGGSAGTAGGVKVGTFFILLLLVWAEVRGRPDTELFGRRIATSVQREAITVLVLGSAVVSLGTFILLATTRFPTDQIIFEVISAFGTVGLSTGITADLPPVAQYTLIVLMFIGRVGTITMAAALATSSRRMPYRYPEERPIVG